MKVRAPLYSLLMVAGAACADPTYHFDIRSSSLDAALKEFASQSGLQVAYFTRIAEGRAATPVSGTLTAEEALRTLLNASGLTFERIDAETVAIRGGQQTTSSTAGGQWEPVAARDGKQPLRLAQADSQSSGPARARDAALVADRDVISEIIVTGTHIRGVENGTVPVMTFDRQYIERSGYTNMMQLIEALPMQFKGGPAGATEMAPFGGAANFGQNLTRGTGFNLHGLGSTATLTLVNGRRVAPSGQGQFIDVATIPLAAVERVEILTDGASAIYGADAVAGVVNILLRKDFSGAETGLQYGAATQGGLEERRISQLVGGSWSTGNALVVAELLKRDELDIGDRDFLDGNEYVTPTYLTPRRKQASLIFNLEQELPANFDLSSTVLYSYEEAISADSSPNSIFTQTPDTNKWSASVGLGYEPGADWRIALDATIAQADTKTDFLVVNRLTGQPTRVVRDYNDTFDTWTVDLKGDGPLFDLPGGTVRLALGGSYRSDDVHSTRYNVIPNTGFQVRAIDAREVKSFFGELYVPLVGQQQNFSWAKRIDLSIAGRYDDYSDFGSTTNPKFGVVWSPIESLDLRASVSSSFRAPTVAEKAVSMRGQQITPDIVDAPGGGEARILELLGSGMLDAEESDNKAFGFTFRPQAAPGLELSVNYFDIDYKNRIDVPPFSFDLLSRRDEYGELITDIGSDADVQAFVDNLLAQDWFVLDFLEIGFDGIRHIVDLRQKNASRSQISGFDTTVAYAFTVGADSFNVDLNVTHLREILTSLTSSSAQFDRIDTYNQPLDWRGRLMGTWTHGGLNTTVAVNYADSYINDSFAERPPIGSWTTVDMHMGYDFSGRTQSALLDGSKLSLSVSNLFDKDPPRAESGLFPIGFDVFNADVTGRFVALRYSKRW